MSINLRHLRCFVAVAIASPIGIPRKPTVPNFCTFSAAADCANSAAAADVMQSALITVLAFNEFVCHWWILTWRHLWQSIALKKVTDDWNEGDS
jgi:hypothetical protein